MDSSNTEHSASQDAHGGLHALLRAAGKACVVGGNQSFLLKAADECWWLERGRIELFITEIGKDGAHGARRHLASVGPDTLLFGLDHPEWTRAGLGLLAVPHADTRIHRLSCGALRDFCARVDGPDELAPPIDRWISALTEGLARWASPSPLIHQSIHAGEACTIPAHTRSSSALGVIWLDLPRDAAWFLGTQDLPPGPGACLFPLAPSAWIQSSADLAVAAKNTARIAADGELWAGLQALHDVLPGALALNLRLSDVDEYNRLHLRRQAGDSDWTRSLRQLRGVLDGGVPERDHADHGLPALIQAMRWIGRHEGFDIRLPAQRMRGDEGRAPTLRDIVQASGLRMRVVRLRAGPAAEPASALLCRARDDGRPMALIPRTGKSVMVADPAGGRTWSGPEAMEMIDSHAMAFTAPLPAAPQGWAPLLRRVAARSRGDLLTLAAAALFAGILGLAAPIMLAYLIDAVLPEQDHGRLLHAGIALGLAGVAGFIVAFVGSVAFSRIRGRGGPMMQSAIVDRLLRLPVRFFREYSAGDLALRASAVNHLEQSLSGAVAQAALSGAFAAFSLALLLYYDLRAGAWAAAAALAYAGLALLLGRALAHREKALAEYGGKLQGLGLQLINGIDKIRLSASEIWAFGKWARLFSAAQRQQLAATRYDSLQALLNGFYGLAVLALLFTLLGASIDAGGPQAMTIGACAGFLVAFGHFNGGILQILGAMRELSAVQPLLQSVAPILRAETEGREGKEDPGELSGAVEFNHVSFRYGSDGPPAVDDVSITARPGEFIAIVGPSGCGKSTLLRLLLGFETPDSGGILLDGQDLRELDIVAVRRQMGVVMQNSKPLSGTLFDNIAGMTGASMQEAWDAAHRAGLGEDIDRMPMGMHTAVSHGADTLSGGQSQRLMIARAIVSKPRILMLDEATSALDNQTQAAITEHLDRLSVTRIVVAHRLSTVLKANRIYVMDAGRIVETGSYDELMRAGGLFARLAQAQLA